MTNGKKDDDKTRADLTRIEDLSEFLHVDDAELEDVFGGFNEQKEATTSGTSLSEIGAVDLNDLDALPDLPETPENTDENTDDNTDAMFEAEAVSDFGESLASSEPDSTDESPFELSSESVSESFPENSDDLFSMPEPQDEWPDENSDESSNETPEETQEEIPEKNSVENSNDTSDRISLPDMHPEKFEEVRNFAQNFSYGQIQGGGNPPFSLILRNLKYSDDADDIIIMLREFGLVTDQNLEETQKALEIGSLLVPQISEYSAIVLAHKLRRFDCDLEVGLSDEVHPSKSGDSNPRGLIKKDNLRQNMTETYKKSDGDTAIKDIIVTTTATLDGHVIKKYIGVQTSFTIVDEEELERLKFVQKAARSDSPLHDYDTEETGNTLDAFKNYQNSFDLLFIDLCDQLKMRALKEKANALLGLNYQLTSMPFEKSANGSSCYQLTCSATLAIVEALS